MAFKFQDILSAHASQLRERYSKARPEIFAKTFTGPPLLCQIVTMCHLFILEIFMSLTTVPATFKIFILLYVYDCFVGMCAWCPQGLEEGVGFLIVTDSWALTCGYWDQNPVPCQEQ